MSSRIGRMFCRLRMHSWETVGVMGLMSPVDECRRGCGWNRVFTGYTVVLYPPGVLVENDKKERS